MKTVLITGGTGMVGSALADMLNDQGYRVKILTRGRSETLRENREYIQWNPESKQVIPGLLHDVHAVVNLAGAGVMDQRWSDAYKKNIAESRIRSGEWLCHQFLADRGACTTLISASAIGWYGPDHSPAIPFTEEAPADPTFLGQTCEQWESSVDAVQSLNIRLVKLRIGIVLDANQGALQEFMKPLRWGIATILGSGDQQISWIHKTDLCRMIRYAIEHETVQGIFNAVAPAPVTNALLVKELAERMRKGRYIPLYVPKWVLRLVLGESSIEVLKSATVSCRKIHQTGFTFLFPSVQAALDQLLAQKKPE